MPTSTPFMSLQVPIVTGDSGAWGGYLNADLALIDALAVYNLTSVSTSGTLTVGNGPTLYKATGGVGGITQTLPDATVSANKGRVFIVVKVDSGVGAVTLNGTAGQTISGSSSLILTTQWSGVAVQCDGANWIKINYISNVLSLAQGGTGANLSATGGANQFVKQSTVGGALTVASILPTDMPLFVASGPSHASGSVPDPGSSAGSNHFLREDATWAVPPGSGGSVGGVNGNIQYNSAAISAGAAGLNTDGNSLFAKGPIPYRDITSYEGVVGTSCFSAETVTGSMTNGSHTLTVSGGTWINGCYVGVANAGPATSLSTPTIASVAFTPATMKTIVNGFTRLSNVVTVTLTNDASVAVGDSILISGATGCSTSVNITATVASTSWVPGTNSPTGNIFTFNQTGANETCGGDAGNSFSPATLIVQGTTGSPATYSYKTAAVDYLNGMTAPTSATTITNSVPTLQGMEPNTVTINCVAGGSTYPVWRQTHGSGVFQYIGSALPCPAGFARQTTSLVDYGQHFGDGTVPQIQVGIPVTNPTGALGQLLITQITAGGGTSTLTLANTASATVSGATTYHDNSTAFNAALAAARTDLGGNTVLIPPTVLPRFCDIDLTTPPINGIFASAVTIQVAGGLWPTCVMHKVWPGYNLVGTGGWNGVQTFNQALTGTAMFVTGDLSPTLFDESGPSIITGFSFGSSPPAGVGGTGNSVGVTAHTQIFGSYVADAIYSDMYINGNTASYTPGLVTDGCSGSGANFGQSFTRVAFIGGVNYPVPAAHFRCSGDVNFNGLFLNNRAMLFDYYENVADGGGFFFQSMSGLNGAEAVHEPAMIRTNFDNSGNIGGISWVNINPSDPLYGLNGIIMDESTVPGQGSLSIKGASISNNLVVGNFFASAVFENCGESSIGAQVNGQYQILAQGPAIFGNGLGIKANGLVVREGSLLVGINPIDGPTQDSVAGITVVDQVSGRTGITSSSFGGTQGGQLLWLDSADTTESQINWTSANAAATAINFQTPNDLSNASIVVQHNNSGGVLTINQNSWQVQLYGQASGNYNAGDFSTPRRVGFASPSNPMFLQGTPTAVRTFTFPDTSGNVSLANVYNESGAITSTAHLVQGSHTLSSGTFTVTLTGASVFSGSTTFSCGANDITTPTNSVVPTLTSGTSITFTGTGTDVFTYSCVGH